MSLRELPLETGAVDSVLKLRRAKQILLTVTSRPQELNNITTSWLINNFGFSFKYVLCTTFAPKGKVCIDHNVDVLIDDSLDNIKDCEKAGVHHLYVVAKPWNVTSEYFRGSIEEITEEILKLC